MNLYRTLGVKKNATEGAIQKAYRLLAFSAHPDRGGDGKKWQQILLAYEVLSNPERRKKYDETGDTAKDLGTRRNAMIQTLKSCFIEAMKATIEQGSSPSRSDLKETMTLLMKQGREGLEKGLKQLRNARVQVEESLTRFSRADDGEDLMAAIHRTHLAEIDRDITAFEANRVAIQDAMEELKNYGYAYDKARMSMTASATAGLSWSVASW